MLTAPDRSRTEAIANKPADPDDIGEESDISALIARLTQRREEILDPLDADERATLDRAAAILERVLEGDDA